MKATGSKVQFELAQVFIKEAMTDDIPRDPLLVIQQRSCTPEATSCATHGQSSSLRRQDGEGQMVCLAVAAQLPPRLPAALQIQCRTAAAVAPTAAVQSYRHVGGSYCCCCSCLQLLLLLAAAPSAAAMLADFIAGSFVEPSTFC